MYYFLIYRRKFDIRVKVISERAGDKNKVFFDKAAIITERQSKTKFFRIWGLKVDLPVPKFNVIQSVGDGRGVVDYLELYRKSEEDFYFLTPSKISGTQIIKADGKLHPMASQESKQIDTDISYWNTKRKQFNKKMFDTDTLLMKILPFVMPLIVGVLCIFVLYILLDHLPGILGEIQKLYELQNNLCRADVITGG